MHFIPTMYLITYITAPYLALAPYTLEAETADTVGLTNPVIVGELLADIWEPLMDKNICVPVSSKPLPKLELSIFEVITKSLP